MVDYVDKDLLTDAHKEFKIEFDGGTITNKELYMESFDYDHTLCSNDCLDFGECGAASISFKINNVFPNLKKKWLTVSVIPDGSSVPFPIGKFKVDSDKVSDDRSYREIKAYDVMLDIRNANVTEWYNGLIFPQSVKSIRDSFFDHLSHIGIEVSQEDVSLPNDNKLVQRNSQYDQVYGGDIIEDVCRINGRFGKADSSGIFRYVCLGSASVTTIEKRQYQSVKYEDFSTKKIDKLYLSQPAIDSDYAYGDGTNVYSFSMNIFEFDTGDLNSVCENLFNEIKDITYIPFEIVCEGNLCLESGDRVDVTLKDDSTLSSYILSIKLSGIQVLKDTLSANGVYEYEDERSASSKAYDYVNGKVAETYRNAFYVYTFTNSSENEITDQKLTPIIQYRVSATSDTDMVFFASIPLQASSDGDVVIEFHLDGATLTDRTVRQYVNAGNNVITLCNYFPIGENRRAEIVVCAKTEYVESKIRSIESRIASLESGSSVSIDTSSPIATIAKEAIKAVLFAKGLSPAKAWDGTINIEERYVPIAIVANDLAIGAIKDKVSAKTDIPTVSTITEVFAGIAINDNDLTIGNMFEDIISRFVITASSINVENAAECTFNRQYVDCDTAFKLITSYEYSAVEETIDSGRMSVLDMDFTQFASVSEVTLSGYTPPVSKNIYLYNEGDECTDVTGGWDIKYNISSSCFQRNSDNLSYTATADSWSYCTSNNLIDLSKYTKIKMLADINISYSSPWNYAGFRLYSSKNYGTKYGEAYRRDVGSVSDYILEMDISSISSAYVYLYANSLPNGVSIKVKKVWLEE